MRGTDQDRMTGATSQQRIPILPYERARVAPNPAQLILDFYRSTYEIGATLAGWDRAALEVSDPVESVSAGGAAHA